MCLKRNNYKLIPKSRKPKKSNKLKQCLLIKDYYNNLLVRLWRIRMEIELFALFSGNILYF